MILVKFSQSGARLSDPESDIRGLPVTDVNGEDIGHISDFYFDIDSKQVDMIEVASGGFLGMGETHFLVNAHDIKRVDGTMSLDKTKDDILSLPRNESVQPVETTASTRETSKSGTMGTRPTEHMERPHTTETGPGMGTGMGIGAGMAGPGRTETGTHLGTEPKHHEMGKERHTGAMEAEHKRTHEHMRPTTREDVSRKMSAPSKMGEFEESNLLGKRVEHEVRADDGTVIATKGDKISKHYLRKAQQHNALGKLRDSIKKQL